jgi:NTE family protein
MLFHLGSLWRLNAAGHLRKIDRISSVPGGSITSGVLGSRWDKLTFDHVDVATNLEAEVVEPLRAFAGKTVDVRTVLLGGLIPGLTINGQLARSYRALLGSRKSNTDALSDTTASQGNPGSRWRDHHRVRPRGVRGAGQRCGSCSCPGLIHDSQLKDG